MRTRLGRAIFAGWIGGFAGNALLGVLFTSPVVRQVLYNPDWQSPIFLTLTPQRNIAVSVAGLVILSGLHGVLFEWLAPCIPGRTWLVRGIVFGFGLWATYWLFQEWFIYVTLLNEPLALALLELVILLAGSLVEGVTIAWILGRGRVQ